MYIHVRFNICVDLFWGVNIIIKIFYSVEYRVMGFRDCKVVNRIHWEQCIGHRLSDLSIRRRDSLRANGDRLDRVIQFTGLTRMGLSYTGLTRDVQNKG